ncbi:hypothetical protein ID866_7240 [Astraeus odoratus]|nr:hypothetical protein ID866_7240 [Astraeus odoratus]
MSTSCLSSGYSALFTWGLLQEQAMPPPSPPVLDISPKNSIPAPAADDVASAYYFTLQTARRDSVGPRSFLYLDLADRRHTRATHGSRKSVAVQTHHRRKPSAASRSTSWTFCTSERSPDCLSGHMLFTPARVPPVPSLPAHPPIPPPALVLPHAASSRRPSRESLRNLPSPKPAPSTTLPDPPAAVAPSRSPSTRSASLAVSPAPLASRSRPVSPAQPGSQGQKQPQPRLSLLTSNATSHSTTKSKSKSLHRRNHVISRSAPECELDASLLSPPPFSPRSPRFPTSPTAFSPNAESTRSGTGHMRTRSMSFAARSESITSSAKKRSRMDALACLEGRVKRGRRISRRTGPRGRNFMSMSDDEDVDADAEMPPTPRICVEDVGSLGDVEDEGNPGARQSAGRSGPPPSAQPPLHVHPDVRSRPSPARSAPPPSTRTASPPWSSSPASVSASALAVPSTPPLGSSSSSSASPCTPSSAKPPSSSRSRKRRSTIGSWLALRSFIDLRADSDERATGPSWNWSFIEIGA